MKVEKRISEHYLKVGLFLTLFYKKKWRKLERELIKLIAENFLERRNCKPMSRHEIKRKKVKIMRLIKLIQRYCMQILLVK